MCGRFATTQPVDAMVQLFEAMPANNLPGSDNFNVCPTNQIHAVHSGADIRHLVSMRWGFIPHWYATENDGPLLINARAETLAEKPAFREACRKRRCLIPVSGFYEWTKDEMGNRLPWYIQNTVDVPLVLAGIWRDWGDEARRTCAIVTCAADGPITQVHHRMPVILHPEDWPLWLGEAGHGAARLMKPAPRDGLRFHRVAAAVNSNRASGPELIEPFDLVNRDSDLGINDNLVTDELDGSAGRD